MRSQKTAAARAYEPSIGRRLGATLIEVLVAIFVMGIGLLAILVLFPLGALNMAQAIRNDRCAQAALNASAIARFLPQDNVPDPSYTHANYGLRNDPAITGPPSFYTTPPGLPAAAGGASYPVYIDPAGARINCQIINPGLSQTYANPGPPLGYAPPQLASAGTITGIPRLMPQYLVNAPQNQKGNPPMPNTVLPAVTFSYLTSRYFTLLDDISFTSNGLPDVSSGNVQRDGRYTWCYMLQLPSTNTAAQDANLTVVVYDRRTVLLDSIANLATPQPPQGERSFMANFDGTTNVVKLTWDPTLQDPPAVRRGSWILDASLVPNIHGFFYRVVGTSDPVAVSGSESTMKVELQNNAQASVDKGVAVVMENVVEVFQRGANK
jgi:hypothetical protein